MNGELSLLAASPQLRNQLDISVPKGASVPKKSIEKDSPPSAPAAQSLSDVQEVQEEQNQGSSPVETPTAPTQEPKTGISFARDLNSGRMFLEIIDRQSGEVLHRIPKEYLHPPEADTGEKHQLNELV